MVIGSPDLNARFGEILKNATHVDIATAWATGGGHLQLLEQARKRQRIRIRAIVGTWGNATRPDALMDLHQITGGDLKIVEGANQLFHPKLYVFGNAGKSEPSAWIGSANFTKAGFGGDVGGNEEIVLEVGPGPEAKALAAWFRRRWDCCPMDSPVLEQIRRYSERWKPPRPVIQMLVSGSTSERIDLLHDAHRLQTFEDYCQALRKCEELLRGEAWGVFGDQRSYMSAIQGRQELLFGDWSQLDSDSRKRLTGNWRRPDLAWWGLIGRIRGLNVVKHKDVIQPILAKIQAADDSKFPDIAVAALDELMSIKQVGHGNATLLLTLARPDRLLSVNGESKRGLAVLSGLSRSTLGKPTNYRKLLKWLYAQPWYSTPCPDDNNAAQIWRFRAALVDAFVYKYK